MTAGPLQAVLEAFATGAASTDEVARRSGLRRDVADAAIQHLVRSGRLTAEVLGLGCPVGGCGTCASGHADGAPGCGEDGPSPTRPGPAVVAYRLVPPDRHSEDVDR